MERIIILLIICLSAIGMNAQNTINGKIQDKDSLPLPFANIVLYDSEFREVLKGTTSNENGKYLFENIANGNYLVEVSMIGYETEESQVYLSSGSESNMALDFVLTAQSETLNEVLVEGRRPKITQTAEKLTVDIENSPMLGSNLQDVMKKLPGVIVTNGNISYAGQQGITILINGKSTNYMDTSALLRDFPANNIAKIELIHQPGAEFDAEGSGPIINVVLKKNVRLGSSGNIKANTGYDDGLEYGTSASFSSSTKNLGWTIGGGYSKISFREDLFITRRVDNTIYDQSTISPFDPETYRLNAGMDYFLDVENTLGISMRGRQNKSGRINSNITRIGQGNSFDQLDTRNSYNRDRIILDINPYYQYKSENTQLDLDFNYVDFNDDHRNSLFKIGESVIDFQDQQYVQQGSYKILSYKGDFKHNFSEKFTVLAGAKFSSVETNSDLHTFQRNSNREYELIQDQSDRFLVNEDILGIYTRFSAQLDKWEVSAGLRWEDSDTRGTSFSTMETNSRKISKLFPSATVGRSLSEKLGTSISYSYRISRPSYSSLNSFVYYYDPYTFEKGNPALKPAFTNNVQFNLMYEEQPFVSIGYNNTKDALFELITQNNETAATSRSIINLAARKNWNFRAFAPLNFVKDLNGYTGFIVNHNQYESESLTPGLNLSKWSLTWFTNLEYQLPWDVNSELTGYYSSGGLQGQIEHDWLAGLSFAFSKDFLDKKLKVNLGIEEVLNRRFFGKINYANVDADIISDWSRQNVYLQFTYNFGSRFRKERTTRDAAQEERNRIESNN